MPHSSRVGSQITGCSNLNPLNAPQRVSEIWLLVSLCPVSLLTKEPKKALRGKMGGTEIDVYYHIWCYYVQSRHTQHHGIHVLNVTGHQFLDSTHIVSISNDAPIQASKRLPCN